jgi:ribonuclease P protein component
VGGTIEMLRSPRDFEALQGTSRSKTHPLLIVRYRPNGLGRDRYGISTGRRLGRAVIRNRVRRRIREVLRHMDRTSSIGFDVLVVARPPSVMATYPELRVALQRLIAGLPTEAPPE